MSSISVTNRITNDDLPALFRACDYASVSAQKLYLWLSAANLGLLITAAAIASLTLNGAQRKSILAIVSAVVLIISVAIIVVIRISKLEQTWYEGRAIAESVKTLAWRYMTRSEPFSNNESEKVDNLFISELQLIFDQKKSFAARLGGQAAFGQCITDKMKIIRNLGVEDRAKVYLTERLGDQREWYGNKAEYNRKSAKRMFIAIIVSHVLAILSAVAMIRWPGSPISPSGIFITLATAFFAWSQMRRHQELAQAYAIAAQELAFIQEQASTAMTDAQLSSFVVNSESAISREHTLWRARRCLD